jgi:hypothetical protein
VTLLCERELGQCGKRLTSEVEICFFIFIYFLIFIL